MKPRSDFGLAGFVCLALLSKCVQRMEKSGRKPNGTIRDYSGPFKNPVKISSYANIRSSHLNKNLVDSGIHP